MHGSEVGGSNLLRKSRIIRGCRLVSENTRCTQESRKLAEEKVINSYFQQILCLLSLMFNYLNLFLRKTGNFSKVVFETGVLKFSLKTPVTEEVMESTLNSTTMIRGIVALAPTLLFNGKLNCFKQILQDHPV